ncbi:MAG: hypothetical protein Satyrvirus24_5 [Satyrvirus sp.]|uniref:Uncharacterized protein n=1 Tax=Satyrvirus sp. TaxID=2487771 RepID=A0A3G5AH03_9VIRU|nr:MAG: hypothetical protein Satyrvirus24_5 [Satyrvirus sp.]
MPKNQGIDGVVAISLDYSLMILKMSTLERWHFEIFNILIIIV